MNGSDRRDLARALVALGLFAATLCVGHALAAEPAVLVVEGRVVSSEPVLAERRFEMEEGDCAPERPAPGAGLVDVLRWDLRADCRTVWRTEEYVDGWRVWYEWDDAVYTRVLDDKPGETVPLRLTLH